MNKPMLFLAPDGDATGTETITAPGVDIPVIEPATTDTNITDVVIPESGIKGPADLFGESPEESMAAAEEKMGKKRKEPEAKPIEQKPAAKKPDAKPKKEPVKPVVEVKPEPAAVTPAKVKIGDEEKTAEEWAAHFKELQEKAKPPEAAKPKEEPKETPDPAKETAAKKEAWITTASKNYAPDEKDLDVILSGGQPAVQKLGQLLAKQAADTREWMATGHAADFAALQDLVKPLLDREKTLAQFHDETSALASQPQLKTHPKGLETYRQVKAEYEQSYQTITDKINAGQEVSPQERAWALLYGSQTPEDMRNSIIQHAVSKLPASPENGTAKPVAAVVKPPPRITTPLRTDKPGGGAPAQKQETKDGQVIRSLQEAGMWD